MGFLDFLLGRKKSEAVTTPVLPDTHSFAGSLFTLDSPNWFGQYHQSPNKRWIISWRDADIAGHRGGYRNSGEGEYLLYDASSKCVVLQGKLERPNNGHVANNGTFVLEDWLFGNALAGIFYGFSAQGHILLQRRLTANLLASAISANGKFAVCQTANSSGEDACSLFLFDLQSGQQLFAARPSAGWTMDYTIDEARVEVIAHVKKLGQFRYDRTGQFLDGGQLEQASLQRGEYSDVIMSAQHILLETEPTQDRVREVLKAIQRARKEGADADNGWKASALKVQGIAHEALGEEDLAMTLYEEALAINSKVGVKRRLMSLQKRKSKN